MGSVDLQGGLSNSDSAARFQHRGENNVANHAAVTGENVKEMYEERMHKPNEAEKKEQVGVDDRQKDRRKRKKDRRKNRKDSEQKKRPASPASGKFIDYSV
ncbi:MAG: hypothetical protein ACQEQ4_05370 [Fibrobacterota bacterium]